MPTWEKSLKRMKRCKDPAFLINLWGDEFSCLEKDLLKSERKMKNVGQKTGGHEVGCKILVPMVIIRTER